MEANSQDVISITPAVIGFVGVLVGAIASLAGTYLLDHVRENRNRKALAVALLAELQDYRRIEKATVYLHGHPRQTMETAKQGNYSGWL